MTFCKVLKGFQNFHSNSLMKHEKQTFIFFVLLLGAHSLFAESSPNPNPVAINGELKQWHKVTLDLTGPQADEQDMSSNPFVDYRFDVQFTHSSGSPSYSVPGYFAADGNAAETSATSGTVWRAHLSPDKVGAWTYKIAFHQGPGAAVGDNAGMPVVPFDGVSGTFHIDPTDKIGRDFRGEGRLSYVGKHHLQFAGSGNYFLKAGPDAPETMLAYSDFDNTETRLPKKGPLKTWSPHAGDWREGDPTWKNGKGKNLIGAMNYLADKGVNMFSVAARARVSSASWKSVGYSWRIDSKPLGSNPSA